MSEQIRFEDGAAYDVYMGRWSQLVGDAFLRWIDPPASARWLDVGCGNGAFTEIVAARAAPASLTGVDPSNAQLAYARKVPGLARARFCQGDGMALPFRTHAFDAAVMPLVIFFLTDPSNGVAEMARVVRPGGIVSAYAWDMGGGGFPYAPLHVEMRAREIAVPSAPSPDAARMDSLRHLWTTAGLDHVSVHEIVVERTFDSVDTYWTTVLGAASVGRQLRGLTPEMQSALKDRLRARLAVDAQGRVQCQGRANAVRGSVAR